jgi:hypothetical protein
VKFHGDELELANDPAAQRSDRFLNEDAFRARWLSSEPLFVVVRKKKLADLRMAFPARKDANGAALPVLIDEDCARHPIRETEYYYLFSNHGS